MTKAAILQIAPEVLAKLLQLPEGAEIDEAWMAQGMHLGPVFLRVKGVGYEVANGTHIPPASPIIREEFTSGGTLVGRSIDWGLDE